MGDPFDYHYGTEAEQYSYFRVPRILITDERFRHVSTDAKLLYGLMLDRMGLSIKNKWLREIEFYGYLFVSMIIHILMLITGKTLLIAEKIRNKFFK